MEVALIGAGRIGTNHAGVLAGIDGVDSLLIADLAHERAVGLAESIAIASAVDVDAAFTADAIVIASSTDTHADLLIRTAEAGLPAFCEKPIALDLASTRRAVQAVEQAGTAVQMGFQRRYDPAIRAIRNQIESGELGTPYLIRSQTHDPEPPPLDYLPVSGGIFKDCLIHDIDVVRYVSGQEVIAVTAHGAVLGFDAISALGDVGTAIVTAEMSGGTLAQLSALRHDPVGYDVRLEVFGSETSSAAGWSARSPIHSTEPNVGKTQDPTVSFWDRFHDAYIAEMEAFIRVLNGEEDPASTPVDAYEDLRVAVACDRSLAELRRVLLEEIE